MGTIGQGQTRHVSSITPLHPALLHLTFSLVGHLPMNHVDTTHTTNGPPINLVASIHVISHADSRHGPDHSLLAIRHLQADAQVPQIAVLARRATVHNHRPMAHAGQATDPPAGIGPDKRSLKATGTYASAVNLDRSHASSLPGHARPQPVAGYVAGQTAGRSATRNTQNQVHMTNQSHTLLGVTPTGIRHRETRPGVPERELDPMVDRDIPHQYNTAGNEPGAAATG